MRYYKDKNSEIYAYEDDLSDEDLAKSIKRLSLTSLTQKELEEFLAPKVDEKAKALAQLEADIKECEDDIKHALIIGNTAVLESLRNEYKELIAQREELRK